MQTIKIESAQRIQALERALQQHMALYGYQPMQLPVIEPAELFLTRASDRIVNKLFTFERYGRQLALRPEFTAAVARHYVQEDLKDPVRWQFSGPIFEDDPDDHSLEFQAASVGAESLGEAGIFADAETIAMTAHAIDKQGIANWQLVIGHVGLQLYLLQRFGLDSRTNRALLAQRDTLKNPQAGKQAALKNLEHTLAETDQIRAGLKVNNISTQEMLNVVLDTTRYGTTMGGRSRRDIAQRLIDKRERSQEYETVLEALDFLDAWVNLSAVPEVAFAQIETWIGDDTEAKTYFAEWQELLTLVEAAGVESKRIWIQADLTRNWEYYTGVVFGVRVPDDLYLAGGGRYDSLARLLGSASDIPAVGVAFYVNALLDQLTPEHHHHELITISVAGMVNSDLMQYLQALRSQGLAVRTTDSETATLFATETGLRYKETTYTLENLSDLVVELEAITP